MIRLILSAVLAVALLWWGWHAAHPLPQPQKLANGAELKWVDCWFDTPLLRPVHCAKLATSKEGVSQFELPVVYFPAPIWQGPRSPVLYISGGPGGESWLDAEGMPIWYDWVDDVDWSRGVVFYDQRGVGLSEPALACAEMQQAREELLSLDIPSEEASLRMQMAAKACYQRHKSNGVDFSAFSTRANARDADDLMTAMGFSTWDVYGVSYGTRVALELMRLAPDKLGAVVLDSVYPPQVNSELSDVWLLHRSIAMYERICELASDCAQPVEVLAHYLDKAVERLRHTPIRMQLVNPAGEAFQSVVFTHEDFVWLLFEVMYQWHLIPDLPEVVQAVANGEDNPRLREIVSDSVVNYLDDSISDAIATAVECNDNVVVTREEYEITRQIYGDTFGLLKHSWEHHACRFWKDDAEDRAFVQPVVADTPVLLLAGEFDPVTPIDWAYLAAETLPNSAVFTFPAIGHGVLDSHGCALQLVREFWQKPDDPHVPECVNKL